METSPHRSLSVSVDREFLGESQTFFVRIEGVLDGSSSSDLKHTLLEHPPFPLEGHLVLDLSRVSHISAAAAGVIAGLRHHTETSGHRFLLAGLPSGFEPTFGLLDGPPPTCVADLAEARRILAAPAGD